MSWCTAELPPLDRAYHDAEWGIPVHDDRRQFEYVSLVHLGILRRQDHPLRRTRQGPLFARFRELLRDARRGSAAARVPPR